MINGQWYEFDDQYVTEVHETVVQNAEAYVLFYRWGPGQAVSAGRGPGQGQMVTCGPGWPAPTPWGFTLGACGGGWSLEGSRPRAVRVPACKKEPSGCGESGEPKKLSLGLPVVLPWE